MHYISYWGGRNHIAFVGDSRIRQLYFDFAGLLSKDDIKAYKIHSDLRFIDEKLSLVVVSTMRILSTWSLQVREHWKQSGNLIGRGRVRGKYFFGKVMENEKLVLPDVRFSG